MKKGIIREHIQALPEMDIKTSWSTSDTEHTIWRRIITTALPFLTDASADDSMTRRTLALVQDNPKDWDQVPLDQWKELIELYCERQIEIMILREPVQLDQLWLQPRKHPMIRRLAELPESLREETMIFAWHYQQTGAPLVACTTTPLPDRLQRDLRTYLTQTGSATWIWEKKNFRGNLERQYRCNPTIFQEIESRTNFDE